MSIDEKNIFDDIIEKYKTPLMKKIEHRNWWDKEEKSDSKDDGIPLKADNLPTNIINNVENELKNMVNYSNNNIKTKMGENKYNSLYDTIKIKEYTEEELLLNMNLDKDDMDKKLFFPDVDTIQFDDNAAREMIKKIVEDEEGKQVSDNLFKYEFIWPMPNVDKKEQIKFGVKYLKRTNSIYFISIEYPKLISIEHSLFSSNVWQKQNKNFLLYKKSKEKGNDSKSKKYLKTGKQFLEKNKDKLKDIITNDNTIQYTFNKLFKYIIEAIMQQFPDDNLQLVIGDDKNTKTATKLKKKIIDIHDEKIFENTIVFKQNQDNKKLYNMEIRDDVNESSTSFVGDQNDYEKMFEFNLSENKKKIIQNNPTQLKKVVDVTPETKREENEDDRVVVGGKTNRNKKHKKNRRKTRKNIKRKKDKKRMQKNKSKK